MKVGQKVLIWDWCCEKDEPWIEAEFLYIDEDEDYWFSCDPKLHPYGNDIIGLYKSKFPKRLRVVE